jgi:hypothetical protein
VDGHSPRDSSFTVPVASPGAACPTHIDRGRGFEVVGVTGVASSGLLEYWWYFEDLSPFRPFSAFQSRRPLTPRCARAESERTPRREVDILSLLTFRFGKNLDSAHNRIVDLEGDVARSKPRLSSCNSHISLSCVCGKYYTTLLESDEILKYCDWRNDIEDVCRCISNQLARNSFHQSEFYSESSRVPVSEMEHQLGHTGQPTARMTPRPKRVSIWDLEPRTPAVGWLQRVVRGFEFPDSLVPSVSSWAQTRPETSSE